MRCIVFTERAADIRGENVTRWLVLQGEKSPSFVVLSPLAPVKEAAAG